MTVSWESYNKNSIVKLYLLLDLPCSFVNTICSIIKLTHASSSALDFVIELGLKISYVSMVCAKIHPILFCYFWLKMSISKSIYSSLHYIYDSSKMIFTHIAYFLVFQISQIIYSIGRFFSWEINPVMQTYKNKYFS